MNAPTEQVPWDEQTLQPEIDRELRLVDTAVEMVRRGAARRVILANLPLGSVVLDAARARAETHGLSVTPVSGPDSSCCALVVDDPGVRG